MTRSESFEFFLRHFSKEELPIALTDEVLRYFSENNKALDPDSIRRFITSHVDVDDEMTEYIPCVVIADTEDMHAVVYWRGTLLSYEYVLATYTKNGIPIQRKVIAGIKSDGHSVLRSVATIEQDWTVQIMVGAQSIDDRHYDSDNSQMMYLELMPNGEIVQS